MHEECIECLHGDKCPAAKMEDGECHGKWIFKSSLKIENAEVLASSSTPLLCCPVCGEKLDISELHLGIVYCPTCEKCGRSFDIDTRSEETTKKLLRKLVI